MHLHGSEVEDISFETDRMQFIGRGRTLRHPQAMDEDILSGKEGSVLDPGMAIRYRILIKANQTATVDLIYGIADTKEACENLMFKYQDRYLKNRAFDLSWTHSQVLLRQIKQLNRMPNYSIARGFYHLFHQTPCRRSGDPK